MLYIFVNTIDDANSSLRISNYKIIENAYKWQKINKNNQTLEKICIYNVE